MAGQVLSVNPPLIAFAPPENSNILNGALEGAGHCTVSILAADQVRTCSAVASPDVGLIGGIRWSTGLSGEPHLPGSMAVLESIEDVAGKWLAVARVRSVDESRPGAVPENPYCRSYRIPPDA